MIKIASFDANGSFGICRTHSKTLRRRKYSKNIVFVPKLSCTSSPFYLTCPDQDGGIASCLLFCKLSCACGFWPRCHASFDSRFPLTIKELWRQVLKRRCIFVGNLLNSLQEQLQMKRNKLCHQLQYAII